MTPVASVIKRRVMIELFRAHSDGAWPFRNASTLFLRLVDLIFRIRLFFLSMVGETFSASLPFSFRLAFYDPAFVASLSHIPRQIEQRD